MLYAYTEYYESSLMCHPTINIHFQCNKTLNNIYM